MGRIRGYNNTWLYLSRQLQDVLRDGVPTERILDKGGRTEGMSSHL